MNFADYIGELLTGSISAIVGFFAGRKRKNAETDSIEIKNFKSILEIHKEEINYVKKSLDENRQALLNCKKEMENVFNEKLKLLNKKS